jgi:hypothetical protein
MARTHCYPDPGGVHIDGAANLTRYYVRPGFGNACFCKVCGSQTHIEWDPDEPAAQEEVVSNPATELPSHGDHIVALNVRCLHGVDLTAIGVNKYDGRDLPPAFTVD